MQLQQCASGGEALATMMSVALDQLHHGLDSFEKKLIDQEQALRSREQQIQRMNLLFDCRYDLLHWQRLFVPIGELNNALKEAFSTSEPLFNSQPYARLQHKLERIDALLQAYGRELDTLIAMGEAASTQRGNDTLKVLANIAILLAPTIAIGAIWGMNIRSLPFMEESWSFPAMCAIDLVLTIFAWLLLWQSDWLGRHLQHPSTTTADGAGRKQQEPPTVGALSRVRSGTKKQAASDSAADIPSKRVMNFTKSSKVDKPRSRH
jgi:Mg2+ and Co2+ transporter CorA